ncbi:hypothetical protein BGZ99_007724 [Dissophora globulifera]|uniref:ARM repeat-containing protein n=1 Tax=Dissophora globulifera TaxID=979702 RepID=A0A9P6RUA1_9FUNG|nr:hypothetical protein BGZ99_007724 [Dissophora globulifera]
MILTSGNPSAIDSQIPQQIQKLEAAKVSLEQDENSQRVWDEVANLFQFFADAAREEENRKKILQENALDTVVEILRHTTQAEATKTASGALLNITMAYEPAQLKAIELGAIEHLLNILKADSIDENEINMTISTRVIANLSELDSGAQSLVKFDGIKTVVQLLQKTAQDVEAYMDLMDATADILRAVASKESAQVMIQTQGLLPLLLDVVENAGTSDEGKTEEEKKEDDKKIGEIKAALVEVVVSSTLADANMVPIFNDKEVMSRFLSWLDLADREDLQTCAALCLGNVARSDQHCVQLVHGYNAVEPLIHVVRKATDLKASHAATGVLRNLALPDTNRDIMGDAGVIQACFPLLKKDNALPLQANIVGILKRLCTNNGHNTIRVISGREPFETLSSTSDTEGELETPLSTLVDLIGRTDDFALKSEGTRTLCNLVKIVWGNEITKEFDTASVTALQQTLNKPEVVQLIAAMTRNPKYVVLQNEGVIALTILVTSPAQANKNAVLEALISIEVDAQPDAETISEEPLDQTKSLTLLESLLSLIKNQDGKCPDEVRTNVCVFLRNAVASATRESEDPAYLTFIKSSGIKDTLAKVQGQSELRPLVRTAIQEVLTRLE